MSESRYISVKDQIHEKAKKNSNEILNTHYSEINNIESSNINDLDEIKLALKYILEKLTSLDDFVRVRRYKVNPNEGLEE